MAWWEWLIVAAAGACGAPLRYVLDTVVSHRAAATFPYGTLAVNLSGSFVLGLITGFSLDHGLDPTARLAVGTGFIGSYTTFSTFTLETGSLLQAGETGAAVRNVTASVLGATLAAGAGWALASL